MPKKMSALEFVQASVVVHGHAYDYSLVEYTGFNGRVKIICPIHGMFEQRAINHTQGKGCAECGKVLQAVNSTRIDTAAYIERAKQAHGDTYDYSQTEYIKYQGQISIVCRVHGAFSQYAHIHLQGRGCLQCSILRRTQAKHQASKESFIARCQAIHPQYDYSEVIYTGSKDKVIVACPNHGQFAAKASSLLGGHGCQRCANFDNNPGWTRSGWVDKQKGREAILYVLEIGNQNESFYKVGITYDLQVRWKQSRIPYEFKEVACFKSASATEVFDLEKRIKRELKSIRYRPLIHFAGATECFSSLPPILALMPGPNQP